MKNLDRKLLKLLMGTILIFISSCDVNIIEPESKIGKPWIEKISVTDDNLLLQLLGKVSTLPSNSSARTLSSNFGDISLTEATKVYDDSTETVRYTLNIVEDESQIFIDSGKVLFENLIIKYHENETTTYILQYEPDSSWIFNKNRSISNFNGYIRQLNLNKDILTETYLQNGTAIGDVDISGRKNETYSCCWETNYNNATGTEFLVIDCGSGGYYYVFRTKDSNCGGGGGTGSESPSNPDGGGVGNSGGTTNPGTSGPGGGSPGGSYPGSSTANVVGIQVPDQDIEEYVDLATAKRFAALQNLLNNNPFALIEIPCAELEKWKTLANKPINQIATTRLNNLKTNQSWWSNLVPYNGWDVVNLQDADGIAVNLDYYSVKVSTLPTGKTADQLLTDIRKDINKFIDPTKADFEPFSDSDFTMWNSANPIGAILHIDMGNDHTWIGGLNFRQQPDDGSVICSDYNSKNWTFTTIQAPGDFQHPVSGNREFGYTTNSDGSYTFYTRGVDRLTGTADDLYNFAMIMSKIKGLSFKTPFEKSDELWSSFQTKLETHVNSKGGSATKSPKIQNAKLWEKIEGYINGSVPISALGCK